MRPESEIRVPTSIRNTSDLQALNRALAAIQTMFKAMSGGEGTILRCKFSETLHHGGTAAAEIHRYDSDGFSQIRDGTVHDEDDIWVAESGDNGWVTARDNEQDEYSLLLVTGPGDGTAGILERLIQAILQKDSEGQSTSLELLIDLLSDVLLAVFESINNTTLTTLINELINAGGNYIPPGGIWVLFGTLSGTLNQGSSATMAVTGSSQTVTVYDVLLGSGQSVPSGRKVVAAWNVVSRRYQVTEAACS